MSDFVAALLDELPAQTPRFAPATMPDAIPAAIILDPARFRRMMDADPDAPMAFRCYGRWDAYDADPALVAWLDRNGIAFTVIPDRTDLL